MRSPIFEVPFYKGQIVDKISNTALTVRGTMPLKQTEKGWAAFTNNNANSYTFTKTLSGTYSIVAFVKAQTANASRYIFDCTTAGSVYYASNNTVTASSGTVYVNNVATTAGSSDKYQCIIVSGITLTGATLYLMSKNDNTLNANGFNDYFAIYSGSLTEKERNEIQVKFEQLQPLAKPTNLIKEIRPVVNFDLNINGNCYVTVPDDDKLDFGTGSFSIAWEDSYPQQQNDTNAVIIMKDSGSNDGWAIRHLTTTTNSLQYIERGYTANTIATSIPNGNHKFLFVRDITSNKVILYVNGVQVYNSSPTATFNNLSNSLSLKIKFSLTSTKSSGSFKNLKIWKGQVLTWKQAQQIPVYKTGLSLHLPMDEGGGLTVYDKSGNGLNGTITQTAAYAGNVWVKKSFPSDIVLYEDWSYQAADGTVRTPNGWIKGTGSYKIVTATQDLGTYKGVKKGENYLECTVAGTVAIPSKWDHGTIEFDLYKRNDAGIVKICYVTNNVAGSTAISNGFDFWINANEALATYRITGGSTASTLNLTANTTIALNTWYRIKKTKSLAGVETTYIKGGAFGTTYQQITPTSGANPATDTTAYTSSFFTIVIAAGDLIGKIIGSTQVY